MIEFVKQILADQSEAALIMMNDCLEKCPPEHWSGPSSIIGKYEFWQVAYHTLCFLDLYLSPNEASFQLRDGAEGLHPAGWREFNDEYPSRRFEKPEMLEYVSICRRKLTEALAAETCESLEAESGFPRLKFSRGELDIYNLRHLQHHTGQLSAFLRRVGADPKRVKTGWR